MEPRSSWLTPAPVPSGETHEGAPAYESLPGGAPTGPSPAPFGPPAPDRPFGAPPEADQPPPYEERRPSWLKRTLAPIAAAIVALFSKLKALLLLLPKLKLLTTMGTMLVSIAAYATIWGFSFAAGFVVLLLVHEMGHVIALRREGIKASAPMFIPFMGALISARSLGDNALAEARVGLAGPILGSIGSAACILIWHATGNDLWRALAYIGFFLNLFNLLPVVPLDGGRAMAAMAPWMWMVGFLGLVAVAVIFPNPIILIILVLAGFETYKRWQRRKQGGEQEAAYYKVAPVDRALIAAVYISLIALLVVGMDATYLHRTLG